MMERSTSYKDKIARGIKPNIGLFSYPILMAADILCFGGEIVPVGKDQKQHLEISRDIAQRFNNLFGDVFIVPEAEIDKRNMLIPGIDGQKMSKTYRNTIPLFAPEEELKQIIMSIKTDSIPVDQPKNPNTSLFHLYSLFLDEDELIGLRDRFITPGLKYGDVKKELLIRILEYFKPFRDKQKYLASHPDDVVDILKIGATKAGAVAEEYLGKAREAMGLNYS
jgi:tryptophanyl-tRNA synthetase